MLDNHNTFCLDIFGTKEQVFSQMDEDSRTTQMLAVEQYYGGPIRQVIFDLYLAKRNKRAVATQLGINRLTLDSSSI